LHLHQHLRQSLRHILLQDGLWDQFLVFDRLKVKEKWFLGHRMHLYRPVVWPVVRKDCRHLMVFDRLKVKEMRSLGHRNHLYSLVVRPMVRKDCFLVDRFMVKQIQSLGLRIHL
jgi:hypothetical protein